MDELVQAAERRWDDDLAAEAAELAVDKADRTEIALVSALMQSLRGAGMK